MTSYARAVDVTGGGEFAAIERLRRFLPAVGDDCAVVLGADPLLLAADTVVAGVHADLDVVGVDDLGWRAVVANVSDVAAMGGRPLHALVAIAGPPDTDLDLLYRGIRQAAGEYGVEVVGGDLANAPTLVVTVAITGTCDDGPPVLRSGAGAGDAVFVTGPLGAAAATGWRARPVALVGHGQAARAAGATAMIDVSDGFAADLGHVADESGVGFELTHVPVAEGATEEHALGGGEDYALVFAAPDVERVAETFVEAGLPVPERVGVCVGDPAVRLLAGRALPPTGWQHRF